MKRTPIAVAAKRVATTLMELVSFVHAEQEGDVEQATEDLTEALTLYGRAIAYRDNVKVPEKGE